MTIMTHRSRNLIHPPRNSLLRPAKVSVHLHKRNSTHPPTSSFSMTSDLTTQTNSVSPRWNNSDSKQELDQERSPHPYSPPSMAPHSTLSHTFFETFSYPRILHDQSASGSDVNTVDLRVPPDELRYVRPPLFATCGLRILSRDL
jgi:hypothetical protein